MHNVHTCVTSIIKISHVIKLYSSFTQEMAATLEPRFEPMKSARFEQDSMAFVDELKTTEKGSILGLLEESATITLESNIMAPNYCPYMEICDINGRFSF